jgi:hypothetical protein
MQMLRELDALSVSRKRNPASTSKRSRASSIPPLSKWSKRKDDCDAWVYDYCTAGGHFLIWQPSSDPAYGCHSDGTWRAAYLHADGVGGTQSQPLSSPSEGVVFAKSLNRDGLRANPVARPVYVDDLTGAPVGHLVQGSSLTGRKAVRARPGVGQPFIAVEVESDTLDPRRDTFGVDPRYTAFYKDLAAREAKDREKARAEPPLGRDAEIELGRLGIQTTFPSIEAAFAIFEDGNDAYFSSPALEDLDAGDITRDFMDIIEVPVGRRASKTVPGRAAQRKHVKLSKTRRGREILEKRGVSQVKAMIKYLFGLAGPKRRWRDVPWSSVNEYMLQIGEVMGDEASLKGWPSPAGPGWYPLGSGVLSEAEFVVRAGEELGPSGAEKLARYINSRKLWGFVRQLEQILKPAKGPAGKEGRERLKCVPKEARPLLRQRLKVLTDWAKWPEMVPEWACVPQATGSRLTLCKYPGIAADVLALLFACQEGYDVGWAAAEREEMWREGDVSPDEIMAQGAGIYPMHAPASLAIASSAAPFDDDDLDLPWERAANPRRASPRTTSLKRKLMSGTQPGRAKPNPTADWGRIHRVFEELEGVERASTLEQLASMIEGSRERDTTIRGLIAQAALKRARRLGFRPACTFPPEECAQEIVEFVRLRKTLKNPKSVSPTASQVAQRMREHGRWIARNASLFGMQPNPADIVRADGFTIVVFPDDRQGYWAQLYDADGPLGSRWYGDTSEEAVALAVESAHDRAAISTRARRAPSPGQAQERYLSRQIPSGPGSTVRLRKLLR